MAGFARGAAADSERAGRRAWHITTVDSILCVHRVSVVKDFQMRTTETR